MASMQCQAMPPSEDSKITYFPLMVLISETMSNNSKCVTVSVLIDSLYCMLYCTLYCMQSVLFNGYIQRLTAYELNGLSI